MPRIEIGPDLRIFDMTRLNVLARKVSVAVDAPDRLAPDQLALLRETVCNRSPETLETRRDTLLRILDAYKSAAGSIGSVQKQLHTEEHIRRAVVSGDARKYLDLADLRRLSAVYQRVFLRHETVGPHDTSWIYLDEIAENRQIFDTIEACKPTDMAIVDEVLEQFLMIYVNVKQNVDFQSSVRSINDAFIAMFSQATPEIQNAFFEKLNPHLQRQDSSYTPLKEGLSIAVADIVESVGENPSNVVIELARNLIVDELKIKLDSKAKKQLAEYLCTAPNTPHLKAAFEYISSNIKDPKVLRGQTKQRFDRKVTQLNNLI